MFLAWYHCPSVYAEHLSHGFVIQTPPTAMMVVLERHERGIQKCMQTACIL